MQIINFNKYQCNIFLLFVIYPNYLYVETSHLIAHKACQNLCQISVLNIFPKSQICTQTLTPPENHTKFFKNQMLPFKHPHNALYFINILLSPSVYTFWDIDQFLQAYPKFSTPPNFSFWPKEPKTAKFIFSFHQHYPQPKLNQKYPKDPELFLILIVKQVCTYFWLRLPVGNLFRSPCLGRSKFELLKKQSNLLKSPTKAIEELIVHRCATRYENFLWNSPRRCSSWQRT